MFVNGLLQTFPGTLSVKKYILKEFYQSFHFTNYFFSNIFMANRKVTLAKINVKIDKLKKKYNFKRTIKIPFFECQVYFPVLSWLPYKINLYNLTVS